MTLFTFIFWEMKEKNVFFYNLDESWIEFPVNKKFHIKTECICGKTLNFWRSKQINSYMSVNEYKKKQTLNTIQ